MSDDKWSDWMFAEDAAAAIGCSIMTVTTAARNGDDDRFERRAIAGDHPNWRRKYEFRYRIDAQIQRNFTIRNLDPATAFLVCDQWASAKDLAARLELGVANIYMMVKSGEVLRRARGEYRVAFWRVIGEWRSISYLADLLEIPRTNLERRLFERDTLDSLQWAHYQVRPINGASSQVWECRIHHNYGPEPLTRDDVEAILEDSTIRNRP